MKFDLEQNGLETVLKPYQAEALRLVWSEGSGDTKAVYEHLKETPHAKSRTAVVVFLNKMVDKGVLECEKVTIRGGWKGVYRPSASVPDERAFRSMVVEMVLAKIHRFAKEGL